MVNLDIPPVPATGAIASRPAVPTAARDVRLGEVCDLRTLPAPLRLRARALVVASVAPGASARVLDGPRACARARAQLPALAARLDCRQAHDLLLPAGPSAPLADRAAGPCAETVRALAAREPVGPEDFRTVACRPGAIAFRYDVATGLSRVGRDLPAGALVRRPPASTLAAVRADQPLVLAAVVGPVRVERQVTALRPARAGARLMVRGADGSAFAAPALESAP